MDSVKDHIVPLIAIQDTAKKMYDALNNLYENENPCRILALKDQLLQVKFTKNDSISSYFLKNAQIIDQFTAVDESIPDRDLVLTSMSGLLLEWKTFVKGTCCHIYSSWATFVPEQYRIVL